MPSLKCTAALKPFDLIKSIQAASQTGLVHEGPYNSEAVLQDIDRCASVATVCALQRSSFILWSTCHNMARLVPVALCLFNLAKQGSYILS